MKVFEGIIVSEGSTNTVVVEIFRKTPHPLYRKLIKRSRKFKVDNRGFEDAGVGTRVKITETRPISKDKYFKISEIVSSGQIKNEKVYLKSERVKVAEESSESAKKETVKKVIRKTKASKKTKGEKNS